MSTTNHQELLEKLEAIERSVQQMKKERNRDAWDDTAGPSGVAAAAMFATEHPVLASAVGASIVLGGVVVAVSGYKLLANHTDISLEVVPLPVINATFAFRAA